MRNLSYHSFTTNPPAGGSGTENMNTSIKDIIRQAVRSIDGKTDYELREFLSGCGITAAIYGRQFYPVGSPEYKTLVSVLTEILSRKRKKASAGVKRFRVDIDYKSKNDPAVFGYECTIDERTIEEVKMRISERKFTNLHSGRVIKPVFIRFDIIEIN